MVSIFIFMKNMYLFCYILLVLLAVGCDIGEPYTEEYRLQYRRPVGLIMSHALDSLQLDGEGVKVGVIDAGFGGFRENDFTRNLKVAACRDFIDGDTTDFFGAGEHDHGTVVTGSIGGKQGQKVHGLAYGATYYLARTEDVATEPKADEVRLTEAVDWLVGEGVRIINISVAHVSFDDAPGYVPEDLDGRTALGSRHIDSVLNANPDLIIVVSAGNRGNKNWRYIMFPSDVEEVITVGSTDFEGISRWKSSGVGYENADYIKPDVATYPIPAGNSHTAPVITGLCALLRQIDPGLDRRAIIDLLHSSGSKADNPDRETGYGVPSSQKIIENLLHNKGA